MLLMIVAPVWCCRCAVDARFCTSTFLLGFFFYVQVLTKSGGCPGQPGILSGLRYSAAYASMSLFVATGALTPG